jgi:hypothetical protein
MRDNSLNWTDCLDSIEALEEIETVFQVGIDEPEEIETVGDLFDALLAKLPPANSGKCASAMAYYRLRQAIPNGDDCFAPSSDLTFLNTPGAKQALNELREKTGLNVPSARYALLGRIGCGAAIISGLAFAVTFLGFLGTHGAPALACLGLAALVIAVGIFLTRLDKGLLPKSCKTLGGLARETAAASYGKLVMLGAGAREKEMWGIFTRLLAERANVPAEDIDYDTTFYKGQKVCRDAA